MVALLLDKLLFRDRACLPVQRTCLHLRLAPLHQCPWIASNCSRSVCGHLCITPICPSSVSVQPFIHSAAGLTCQHLIFSNGINSASNNSSSKWAACIQVQPAHHRTVPPRNSFVSPRNYANYSLDRSVPVWHSPATTSHRVIAKSVP